MVTVPQDYRYIKTASTRIGVTPEEYITFRQQGQKFCSSCRQWLNSERFQSDASKFDGLSSRCGLCIKAFKPQYQWKPKDYFKDYQKGAKRRSLDFSLSFEEFMLFWQCDCFYCGTEIDSIGIDRVDNSIGYCVDNCVSCCGTCNKMKSNLSKDEWFSHLKKVCKHSGFLLY